MSTTELTVVFCTHDQPPIRMSFAVTTVQQARTLPNLMQL